MPRYGFQDLVFGALDIQAKEIDFRSSNSYQYGVEWETLNFVDIRLAGVNIITVLFG